MAETRYPSIFVDRLGRQLSLWTKYGISDARALKLLRLWLGYDLVHLMDKKGRYTFHNFNAIRQMLGYKTVLLMLEDVRLSQSFILLSCDVEPWLLREHDVYTQRRPNRELVDGLTMFYSPLWHEWEESEGMTLPGSILESRKSSRKCDGLNNNALDNNNPTGGTAKAVAAGDSAAGGQANDTTSGELTNRSLTVEQVSTIEELKVAEHIRDAKFYFRGLVGNKDDTQREPIDWLIFKLQQPVDPPNGRIKGYGLTREEATEVLEVLIDTQLAPHFARDRNFMSPARVAKPQTRIYHVTNYIKGYSGPMLERAVKRWKKRAHARRREQAKREGQLVRLNRPISPYEWQDPDGRRWMETRLGEVLPVPEDAAPRPSDTAVWNYIGNCWT